MFEAAEEIEKISNVSNSPLIPILVNWVRREGHLAIERAYLMMKDGVPDESAWFLAVDDSGFQLAAAYTVSWADSIG